MAPKRWTWAQRRAIRWIAHGENPWAKIHGRSEHGGMTRTICSLFRAKLIEEQSDVISPYKLTPAGRSVLNEEP